MTVSVSYPKAVVFQDGSRAQTTEDTWTKRQLVVETDQSETEVRDMLAREGFEETSMEYPKPGRLGHGMVKRFSDWQVHVRLFQHGDNIQIDGEVEVSKEYMEHLTYDWIPALDACLRMIRRNFGRVWIYHKGYQRYVKRVVWERLSLDDPESKTSAAVVVGGIAVTALAVLLAALSKRD